MALVASGNETAGVVASPVFSQTVPCGIVFAFEERVFRLRAMKTRPGAVSSGNWGTLATLCIPTATPAATDYDGVNEAIGSITLTVLLGNGYALGNRSSATPGVEDYDVPEFSVVAGDDTTNGSSATLFR